MRSDETRAVTRRAAMAAGLSAAGALALGLRSARAAAPITDSGPYGPFKMGLQSYSLRAIGAGGKPDLDAALAATQELGLHYWESYPAHIPTVTDPGAIAGLKSKCAAAGVTVLGYGVVRLTSDLEAGRKVFDFAKQMGIEYLSADPNPDSFATLDKLVEEYGVNVGIHNHGPGHRWAMIDTIAEAIKSHDPRIGCCVDTGHFLRSREDPVRAVEVFGSRVYGVHVKDVKDAISFTLLGEGDLRLVDLLRALAKLNYRSGLNLEYEENPKAPLPDIGACLKAARDAVAKL
jgi:inosose dehydratase